MSWITILWSMNAAVCLTLGAIYLLIWSRQRQDRVYLIFCCSAVAVAAMTALEFCMMRAETPGQYAMALRWMHVPVWVILVTLVGFIRLYLQAGRPWLAWTVCILRTLSLILNFLVGQNLNFREVTGLRHVRFLGDTVSVGDGVLNLWMLVAQLSLLLFIVFIADATLTVWRRGDRRQALLVGGSILLFALTGTLQALLITWQFVHWPLTASLFYMVIVMAMCYELSRDVLRSAELAEELRTREQRLDLAASGGGLGLWMWDIATDHVWINDKGRSLFGFTAVEKLNAERFRSRIHPEDREILRKMDKAFGRGDEYETEYRIGLPNGQMRWLHSRGRVELSVDGKARRMHGVCIDVTVQKMAEERLRESELRFRTMADSAPVMIWMAGTDKLCTFFNQGWLEFTGRELEQELGNGWAVGVYPEDFDRCLSTYEDSFAAQRSFTMEYRLRRNDGEYHWVLDTGTPRFAPDGAFLGYIGSCIDISERKLAELDTQRHRAELAHLSRVAVMGEMSASLAHELNQPLTGIVSNAAAGQRLIDNGQVTFPELRELLVDITADGRRAGEVIRGIWNMVRKGDIDRQPMNLNNVVMNVVRIVHPDALLRSCDVKTSLEPNLPEIEGDPVQLRQVLLNLVINAFDAMHDAPVGKRKVEITTAWNGNGAICASVRDYGVGIPEAAGERLFDPFFTTKAEGLGVGLAIVRSIVESHGGVIAAENVEGGGARFHFTISVNNPTAR